MQRDPTRATLTDAERILLGYLHRHCRGVARARTYSRLRQDLAAVGLQVGEREMYELISSLRLKRRPVATTPAGAYVWETPRDVRLGLRNLVGRVLVQHRGIRAYKAAAREGLTQQRYLDLTDAERAYDAELRAMREASRTVLAEKMAEAPLPWVLGRVRRRRPPVQQGDLFENPAPGSRT